MLRVLQVIGSLNIGGSQSMIINIYKNIDREKIQFDFILDHPNELYYEEEVKALGAKIYFMPTFKGSNIRKIRKTWERFFSEHNEYKIIHSHVRSYASIYIPIAKKHGLLTIIHSHSTSNGSGVYSLIKSVMQYPLRYQGDYFMACSEESGQWLFGKKVCKTERFQIVKNAIDTKKYSFNQIIRDKYRKKLRLNNKYVIGHVGRFHEAKNHKFLIEIFAEVHKINSNAILLLVGDGELRSDIEVQIKELGLEEVIILLGNRSDVPELMQAMDVFVFPSTWEGLGIVAIEAQAAGLHVICSDKIPKEAFVTKLITKLPLNKNVNLWSREIIQYVHAKRAKNLDEIKKSGYDVVENANWLQSYYRNILNEKRLSDE